MNETTACLAITEKKPAQRPGGCVGIFFQLFDWNRRLAKKKLFSKKLLPPARAKQASKKFGGNDKLSTPKLHLIADENRGGFPNVKKNGVHGGVDMEQKHDMHSPSLVARLMGLESMPDVRRDKPRKALGYEISNDREEKFVSNRNGSDKEDSSLEKGLMKHGSRPEKLQKTEQSDRRAVTRFGSEALQFKNVLSRSRKHHHPKLASPVKSPRVLSGKSASRWIDAAAKILEPGLQATNRAKCALTYSDALRYSSNDKVMIEGKTVLSPEVPRQTGYYANSTNSFVGQSSCENCGNYNLSDVVILRPNVEEHPSVFGSSASSYVNASSLGPGGSKPRPPKSSPEQERAVGFRSHDQAVYLASKSRDNIRSHNEPFRDAEPFSTNGQERWHFSSQPRKPLKDERTPIALKHMTRTPSQMSQSRERIATRSKLSSNLHSRRVSSAVNGASGPKDFVALNRNLSGRTRSRMPNRVDKSNLEAENKYCDRQDDSLSNIRTPVRKRRTINVSGQVENTKHGTPAFGKQENAMRDGMTVEGIEYNAHSMNQSCVTSKLAGQERANNGSSNKNVDVISFAFNSPVKKKTILSSKDIESRRDRDDFVDRTTSEGRKLTLNENGGITSFQKQLPMSEDALGALLVQKLKELTCEEEDVLATRGTPPKRTTAVILQELISALTEEQPVSQNDGANGIDQNGDSYNGNQYPHDHLFSHGLKFNGDKAPQARTKTPGTTAKFLRDGDHFSPGSVLEASFSTDSCISSSLDDNSGHQMHVHEFMDFSYDLPQSSQPDAELVDSGTSFDKARTGSEMVTDVVNCVTKILHNINLSGLQLSGSKLYHLKEVLLNAELLFGIAVSHSSHGMKKFSIGSFLLNELETLAAALWTNFNCLVGFEDAKENQLREFLFDCVIEYLESNYAKYCKSGFKAFTRLPSCMNTSMFMQGVCEEVRSWTDLAEMNPDEIIEWEMSHSLGKWTDFDIEAFETGAAIDGDILQILLEELVTDLCESRRGSF